MESTRAWKTSMVFWLSIVSTIEVIDTMENCFKFGENK